MQAQMGVGRLPVDWNGVVDDRAHPTLLQGLLDPVAAAALGDAVACTGVGGGAAGVAERLAAGATADAHHELVPAVAVVGCRQGEAVEIAKGIPVTLGDGCSFADPLLKPWQLHVQDSRLDRIQPAVVAKAGVQIALGHAVHG